MITDSTFGSKLSKEFDEMLALSYDKRPITPLEEPAINVYLNTRHIDLPLSFEELAVQGDHRAERVWFAVDRYFDGKDLADDKKVWVVQFVNAAGEASMTSLTKMLGGKFTGDEVDDKTLRLGWELENDLTKAAGLVTFSLRCYEMNNDGMFEYNLGTEPATARISKGLMVSAGTGSTLPSASDLEKLVYRIEQLYDKYYGTLTNISYENIIKSTLPIIDETIFVDGKLDSTKFKCADFENIKNKPKITVDGVEKTIGVDKIEVTKITVDSVLNATSEWPVQNQVITKKVNAIDNSITAVNDEIQNIKNQLENMTYIPLKILNFTNDINYVEKNHSYDGNIIFNWEIDGQPTSQEIMIQGRPSRPVDASARTYTYELNSALSDNTTFILSAQGSMGSPVTATSDIIFTYKVFYGAAFAPEGEYTPDFLQSLAGSSLQETKETTFTIDNVENQYIYFALPQSYGTPIFSVGGFVGGFGNAPIGTVSYNETNYDIWKSDNMITATNREFKVV